MNFRLPKNLLRVLSLIVPGAMFCVAVLAGSVTGMAWSAIILIVALAMIA